MQGPSAGGAPRRNVVALCGGVGGAKLALGLYRVLAPHRLTLVVNTGDDFTHLGLQVCPDIDTVLYTLAGLADPERGWGRAGESWHFMETLGRLGGPTWFQLGDHDLALHAWRTSRLRDGASLSTVTAEAARVLGVAAQVLPMSDQTVRTVLETAEGPLPFQTYFVARRCEPPVRALRFDGAEAAVANAEALAAITSPGTEAVVICPSNPYLSINPVLSVPGVRQALMAATAPVVVVSPIVGGDAVKGPTAKLMRELGHPVDQAAIAAHYAGLADGLVIDASDRAQAGDLRLPSCVTRTLMRTADDRANLARAVLDFADALRRGPAIGEAA